MKIIYICGRQLIPIWDGYITYHAQFAKELGLYNLPRGFRFNYEKETIDDSDNRYCNLKSYIQAREIDSRVKFIL